MGRSLFDQGMLDLLFLTVEGKKAAAMWQFVYGDRMMLYNSGLNPSDFAALSPGIVLSTYSIEASIEKGLALYDFLRGDETYKYRMGARDTSIYRISVHR
jgi:CelD/BcsL family acetyltransferase involved in cellulose biosynthesis